MADLTGKRDSNLVTEDGLRMVRIQSKPLIFGRWWALGYNPIKMVVGIGLYNPIKIHTCAHL